MTAGRSPRTNLEYELKRLDMTQEDVAKALKIDVRYLRRLASGDRGSAGPAIRRALQDLLGRPAHELFAPFEPGEAAPPTAVSAEPAAEDALSATARRARTFVRTRTAMNVEALEQLDDAVRELAADYLRLPVAALQGELGATQAYIFGQLDERLRPAHARRLYFLGGVVEGMLANASHDLADLRGASIHIQTAMMCAEYAEDDRLRAWVYGMRSLIGYRAGRFQQAIRDARQGASIAVGVRTSAGPWLAASEARALGRLGHAKEARLAIERAEAARHQVLPNDFDAIGGICYSGPLDQAYYSADALIWLAAETRAAEEYCGSAVELSDDVSSPEWDFGCHACSRLNLGITRIRRGELDSALAAVRPAFDLPVEQRITGVLQSTAHLARELSRSPVARDGAELRARIAAFVGDVSVERSRMSLQPPSAAADTETEIEAE